MSDSVKIKVPAMLEPGSGSFITSAEAISEELSIRVGAETVQLGNQHAVNTKILEVLNMLLEDGTTDETNYATIISLLNNKADLVGSLSMEEPSEGSVPATIFADVAIQAKTDEKGNNLYKMYLRLQELGILDDLNTDNRSSLVAAINSVLSVVASNKLEVGELDNLRTKADSIVSAINSLEDVLIVLNNELRGQGTDSKLPYKLIKGTLSELSATLDAYGGTNTLNNHDGNFRYYFTDDTIKYLCVNFISYPIYLELKNWVQVLRGFIDISDDGIFRISQKYSIWYRESNSRGWSTWKNDVTGIISDIGNLEELQTSRKESIVSAINSFKGSSDARLDRLDERSNLAEESLEVLSDDLVNMGVTLRGYIDTVKIELDGVKAELEVTKTELDTTKTELAVVKTELDEVKTRLDNAQCYIIKCKNGENGQEISLS